MERVNLDEIKRIIKQKFDLFYNYLIEHRFSISKNRCSEVINEINKEKDYQFYMSDRYSFSVKTTSWEVQFSLSIGQTKITTIYDLVEEG